MEKLCRFHWVCDMHQLSLRLGGIILRNFIFRTNSPRSTCRAFGRETITWWAPKEIERPEVEGEHGRKKRTILFFFPLQLFSLIFASPKEKAILMNAAGYGTGVVTKVIPSHSLAFPFLVFLSFSARVGGKIVKSISLQHVRRQWRSGEHVLSSCLVASAPLRESTWKETQNWDIVAKRNRTMDGEITIAREGFSSPMLARRRRKA